MTDVFFDPPHPQTVCGILKDHRITGLRTARNRLHVDGAQGGTFQSGQDAEKRCLATARGVDSQRSTSNETLSRVRSFPKLLTRFQICMAGLRFSGVRETDWNASPSHFTLCMQTLAPLLLLRSHFRFPQGPRTIHSVHHPFIADARFVWRQIVDRTAKREGLS